MGDSLPRPDPTKPSCNACDHPYGSAEEQTWELTDPNGYVVMERKYTVCLDCGYVLDQPDDMPEVRVVGTIPGDYPPRGT